MPCSWADVHNHDSHHHASCPHWCFAGNKVYQLAHLSCCCADVTDGSTVHLVMRPVDTSQAPPPTSSADRAHPFGGPMGGGFPINFRGAPGGALNPNDFGQVRPSCCSLLLAECCGARKLEVQPDLPWQSCQSACKAASDASWEPGTGSMFHAPTRCYMEAWHATCHGQDRHGRAHALSLWPACGQHSCEVL